MVLHIMPYWFSPYESVCLTVKKSGMSMYFLLIEITEYISNNTDIQGVQNE